METITVKGEINSSRQKWENGKSMHFRARWRIDHQLTAENINDGGNITDILFLMAFGKGRIVGTSALLYNPSCSVTSWGNWWGEGDEKIYTDQDTFPSIFGTGSEDYFNYSWSSPEIFSYPYCGQPRNDGPGNRGYVSNFRWHISDDILFNDKLAFFMEMGNHGKVPGFSYGRIVYFYSIPELIDDHSKISMSDLADISYRLWNPIAYCGSAGYNFIQAEKLIAQNSSVTLEKGNKWADGNILMWTTSKSGEQIILRLNSNYAVGKTNIGLTMAHSPDGAEFCVKFNGKNVQFDGKDTLDLFQLHQCYLANHFSESISLKRGVNEICLTSVNVSKIEKIGIDFVWIRDEIVIK